METIILASASNRRQEILQQMGVPYRIISRPVDETIENGADPRTAAVDLARKKVDAVVRDFRSAPAWILGADTVVTLDGRIYGKPADAEEARVFLQELAGETHSVVTGIALRNARTGMIASHFDETQVVFSPLTEEEIAWYVETNEWQGVAGGYRIQGRAACFIERIHGSYSTVMGLPIRTLYSILRENHYQF